MFTTFKITPFLGIVINVFRFLGIVLSLVFMYWRVAMSYKGKSTVWLHLVTFVAVFLPSLL